METPLLRIRDVEAGYGKSQVLHGVSLEVHAGEIVGLMGRNGMGKTTSLKVMCGLLRATVGTVEFSGADISTLSVEQIARAGMALVPDHRGIFTLLSVEENLRIALRKGGPWNLQAVYEKFPRLRERHRNLGGALSGGEQQMLSIARALMQNPRVLLLDEPTEGLAPVIVDELVATIRDIARQGLSIVLVEQSFPICRALASRHYILEEGAVVFEGDNAKLDAQPEILNEYLGLSTH